MEPALEIVAKIKGLVKDADRHGNVRYYFRRRGLPKVRLREPFGEPQFMEELRCAQLGLPYAGFIKPEMTPQSPVAKIGSLKWLCLEYLVRARSQWSDDTHERKNRMLTEICEGTGLSKTGIKNGDLAYAGMQLKHVAQIRDEKADVASVANRRVKELGAMFNWAIGTGLTTLNPADKCAMIKRHSAGYHAWSLAEIAQFKAFHPVGSQASVWFHILLFTGLRKGDAALLGRQHIYMVDGERRIRIRPGKTETSSSVVVDIPLLAPLAAVLDALPASQLAFLCGANGKPYGSGTMGNYMRDWCNAAQLPQCSSHGLRKAGAVIAAESGATSNQLQAIYGWTTSQQSDHYTKAASRQKLATDGARHLKLTE